MVHEILLGGKLRPIEYNINALIDFDEITGLDIMNGVTAKDLRKLKNLRALAYVGLKHGLLARNEKVDITLEEVGTMLSFTDGSMEKVLENFKRANGNEQPGEEGEGEKKK